MADIMKLVCVLVLAALVSAEDTAASADMCVDELASILCELCNAIEPSVPLSSCCLKVDTLRQCEVIVSDYAPKLGLDDDLAADYLNEVDPDYIYMDYDSADYRDDVDKRAAWTWKKPAANWLDSAKYRDLGFRGKRYSTTGRYSWKPAAYRQYSQQDPGFRGKRVYQDSPDPEYNPAQT